MDEARARLKALLPLQMHLPYRAGMWLESAPLCLFREPFLVCVFQETCLEACGGHVRSQIAEPSSFLDITPQNLFVQGRADGSL
jgi:hypothetical protein